MPTLSGRCYFCNEILKENDLVNRNIHSTQTPYGFINVVFFVHIKCEIQSLKKSFESFDLETLDNFDLLKDLLEIVDLLTGSKTTQ